MADVHSTATRSYNMSRIRSKDTHPEIVVRRFLHTNGFRFRLHRKDLPGKPDIVFTQIQDGDFCTWMFLAYNLNVHILNFQTLVRNYIFNLKMPIPQNITRDHLLQAIRKLDIEGIPKDGDSQYYDVIYEGGRYPPKVVVSYANIFANGKALDRNSFSGGLGTECFNLLKQNSFIVEKKINHFENEPKVWFVTQGATFTENRGMKFLWAPMKGKDNKPRFYWENLLQVKKGDFIFNYSEGLKGISIALKDGYKANNDEKNSPWGPDGYRVDIGLVKLVPAISSSQLANNKNELNSYLSSILNKPFNTNGGVNQGYLYEFTKEAGKFIRDIYGKEFGKASIDSFFDKVNITVQKMTSKTTMKLDSKYRKHYLSIKTKPFIILAGLSGTGKSRLVRTLAYQFNNIAADKSGKKNPPTNFQLIKVKPNWHDSSELLGYESRISGKDRFVATDFIRFIVKAWQHPDTPFFLCLDEMNLAPVEQYFAEYLSAVETRRVTDGKIKTDCLISGKLITKYSDKANGVDATYELWNELELTDTGIQDELKANGLGLPSNLIVMGTVNMDETTHSFSRKVLDRAMTIEMNDINLSEGLGADTDDWNYPAEPLDKELVLSEKTQGTEVFAELSTTGTEIITYLDLINTKLEGSPFKIAYRVRDEFLLFAFNYSLLETKPADWIKNVLDEMTLMKILPRIEGDEDRTKLLDDLIFLFQEYNLPKSLNKATVMATRRKLSHYTSFWS